MKTLHFVLIALFAASGCLVTHQAVAGDGWRWDLRYRLETVDDGAFGQDASAHTARLRLGYLFEPADAWRVYIEGEHIESFGNSYNSTANARASYPVIADPKVTEINQLFIGLQGEQANATLGRQRILLDNQRFIGNVGWRQNEQTYDAITLDWNPAERIEVSYSWIDRVHRVFGDRALAPLLRERRHDSHLFNIRGVPGGGHTLSAYAYLLKDRDQSADSSATMGLRWQGKVESRELQPGWTLEIARQRDFANQPMDLLLAYYLVEPQISWNGYNFRAGWERLQGDGQRGFMTPLATLHAFNGWADRFLMTPPDGLDDQYMSASGRVGQAGWTVAWHRFTAARGQASYGKEWNASFRMPLPAELPGMLRVKYADYRSDGFGSNVRKFWVQLEW